jgi:protein SCO1/2
MISNSTFGETLMKTMRSTFIILFLCSSLSFAAQLPSESVYQYDSTWFDQNNQANELSELKGEARLVAFVYTYCEHTCPLIIAQIKEVLQALPEPLSNRMPVTLITLDPTRDTPEQMKAYMLKNYLDEKQWTMLAGDEIDVRVLSNLFNVKYKAMSKDELAHSNMITLLDAEGVIRFQLKGLNEDKSKIVSHIVAL